MNANVYKQIYVCKLRRIVFFAYRKCLVLHMFPAMHTVAFSDATRAYCCCSVKQSNKQSNNWGCVSEQIFYNCGILRQRQTCEINCKMCTLHINLLKPEHFIIVAVAATIAMV